MEAGGHSATQGSKGICVASEALGSGTNIQLVWTLAATQSRL
ncbi:hypothetical protein RBWH47_03455 [Rhodopirellula baltica WH47]|uniref:Uncharacterized protein n=1 Tax=Rhodopirellula baltica WH47 TaxID=991778 RepID=F2APG4_RHOBT|nr:hypothetical protein RBWH47_03455 [Rhodopirellula baltica WH47]